MRNQQQPPIADLVASHSAKPSLIPCGESKCCLVVNGDCCASIV
jgi:hypothetical protein